MRLPAWYVRWPLFAIAFQAVPWVGFNLIARAVHAKSPLLSIDSERPLTLGLLVVSAVGSWLLGLIGTYVVLRHARPRAAAPLVVFCCVPALMGAALYSHALLVFLAVV